MRVHITPRLTDVDRARIRAYLKQDAVLQTIATETGYTVAQLRNFFRRLEKQAPASSYPPQVLITQAQHIIIARCRNTELSLPDLAKRVEAEYGVLVAELAGLKTMSAERIRALQAVCTAEKC